ncbi:MAG TPA: DUF1549 and DUF1553 domain-containing protein [Planctomycetota bacterium]|nr:DUF1549 and DUF1553 domain-containing protein [Planctomycetota bacterium]
MRYAFVLALAGLLVGAQEQEQPSANGGRALIDRLVKAKIQDLQLTAAGPADSSEFLRRVTLDITGTIPTLEQVEKFLKDGSSDKRTKLVDELLASEKYADHMASIWSGLLVGNGEGRAQASRLAVQKTMKDHFAKNMPFDEFARQVITAEGVLPDPRGMARGMMGEDDDLPDGYNGLVAFFVSTQQTAQREMPQALAGRFARVFMGTQIQCAQCHDHPFDKWTQEDFYGMAAFFTQVTVRRNEMKDDKDKKDEKGDKKKREDYSFEVSDAAPRRPRAQGLVIPDSKNKTPVKPSFLVSGGKPQAGEELRAAFARFMTGPENRQFPRAIVNRTWGRFMGRGFVNPVDNFDQKNAPSHPDLLDELADDFARNGFDMKRLIREIALSETYQRTSRAKKRDAESEKYYAVAAVRALTPEQIMNSLYTAATVPGDPKPNFRPRELIQTFRDFRYAFGDDEAAEMVEFQGTIPAALLMMNSPAIQRATMAAAKGAGGRLANIVNTFKNPRDQVTAMVGATLSRAPTNAELNRFVPIAAKGAAGAEDVYWTLLNSSEFLFNK